MLIATFGPSTGWQGREIIWDENRFVLVGHGTIPAAGVLDYDRRGQLIWASPEFRTWAFSVAQWEATGRTWSPAQAATQSAGQPAYAQQPTGPAGAQPSVGPAGAQAAGKKGGLPAWAIALIIVGVLVVVLSVLLAIMIPSFVVRTGETISNDLSVSTGLRNIQMGVETWATEHGGRYPEADLVTSVGLSRYISDWPTNPYTDLPMAQGSSQGDFGYKLTTGGTSYRLVGYGRDGKVVVELTGGGETTY